MANKINHLLNAYRQLNRHAANCVLATIIETFGSTYQKAGARMLIALNGEMAGLLGGGCFEKDLMEQALSVFETGQAKTLFYDMRSPEDAIWGLGLGCNGAVRVLLQLLKAEENFSPLNTLAEAVESHQSGILATICESKHPDFLAGSSLFLSEETIDSNLESGTSFPFMASVRQTFVQRKPRIESHSIDDHSVLIFYDSIQPPWHLLVLGAGADAVPLVQCAKALGWRVTVADYRPGHIKQERFPQVDNLCHLTPQDFNENQELNRFNAMVLMTHNIEYDQRYLKAIANSRIPFIGLLGPPQRRDRLLQSLGNEAAQIRARVFGPVGLDIGAESPEEIALSIIAGIHAALNGRSGGQLDAEHEPSQNANAHECLHR
ncbi:MAG: XdhC family protein [Gammaproteobacteria bacterium]